MSLKLIFKGRMHFGTQRSYDLAVKHFLNRTETIFRNDVLFKPEQVLDEEALAFVVPNNNYVVASHEKAWKTTSDLLKELAQFAVMSNLKGWAMSEGALVDKAFFEPKTDKTVVMDFALGRQLVEEKGREMEAMEVLSRAIERYKNHALAYERRGYVNFRLGNYNDAMYDFSKSIDINPDQAEAFFGRGKVKMIKQDWKGGLEDFVMAMSKSIALQPFFWQARRAKGECLMHLKQYREAAVEFQKFEDRKFKTDDPNFTWKRKVAFLHGKALFEAGETVESIKAFTSSLEMKEGLEFTPDSEVYFERGLAQKQLGKREFYKKDIEEAARQGHKKARKLLAEFA